LRELLEAEIREWVATPETQRLTEQVWAPCRIRVRTSCGNEMLEPVGIELTPPGPTEDGPARS
jgi:hypothetical protein